MSQVALPDRLNVEQEVPIFRHVSERTARKAVWLQRKRLPLATLGLIVLAVWLSGCGLFPYTQLLQEEGNWAWRFRTNDKSNCQSGFFRAFGTQSFTIMDFSFIATKESGAAEVGYGAYFASAIDGHYEAWSYQYGSTILINTLGQYSVVEYLDQSSGWKPPNVVIGWTESQYLKPGYKVANRVGVKYNPVLHSVELYFNDNLAASFSESLLQYQGGEYGLLVMVGSHEQEDFPCSPVDVLLDFYNTARGLGEQQKGAWE